MIQNLKFLEEVELMQLIDLAQEELDKRRSGIDAIKSLPKEIAERLERAKKHKEISLIDKLNIYKKSIKSAIVEEIGIDLIQYVDLDSIQEIKIGEIVIILSIPRLCPIRMTFSIDGPYSDKYKVSKSYDFWRIITNPKRKSGKERASSAAIDDILIEAYTHSETYYKNLEKSK